MAFMVVELPPMQTSMKWQLVQRPKSSYIEEGKKIWMWGWGYQQEFSANQAASENMMVTNRDGAKLQLKEIASIKH